MQTRNVQQYFKDHLAELRSDYERIQANAAREDKDYQFFEADTTSRVQVLLQALKAPPSIRDKVAQDFAGCFDSVVAWAEHELGTLDATELNAAHETCSKATVEDASHRQLRNKVLNEKSRRVPKSPLPKLMGKDPSGASSAETMTLREFCAKKDLSGTALNRAMERLRKRLESRGLAPVVPGRRAGQGRTAIPKRYAISDLTNCFESPGQG